MTTTRKPVSSADTAALEALVDRYTLAGVVEALAEVAYLKGEHAQYMWQDEALAHVWRDAGAMLLKLVVKLEKDGP